MLDFWSDESSTDSESEEDQGGVLEPVSQSEAEVIESNQRLHRVALGYAAPSSAFVIPHIFMKTTKIHKVSEKISHHLF